MIDGHNGVCFAFGVFVDGHFLEGSLTYVVGLMQVRDFLKDNQVRELKVWAAIYGTHFVIFSEVLTFPVAINKMSV